MLEIYRICFEETIQFLYLWTLQFNIIHAINGNCAKEKTVVQLSYYDIVRQKMIGGVKMMLKKLAIIGASYLQEPLIRKAKEMGIETHVFAWQVGDVGEEIADYFYPISIVEKEEILHRCQEIGVNGICTIASDLAAVTVCYVAEKMGLPGNSIQTGLVSTNKHEMRKCFERNGDPSPKSLLVEKVDALKDEKLGYPLIVKPLDRSGSRGITKVNHFEELESAIERAKDQGFEKKALVEEFAEGKEYSVEFISWQGRHTFLALTEKFTTGAPGYVETGHIQPANIKGQQLEMVESVVCHALDSLGIKVGASHSEVKIDEDGNIKIIEIGGRMGGDFIGSHMVNISTGVDFVEGVIKCALGEKPDAEPTDTGKVAAVRFILNHNDKGMVQTFIEENSSGVVSYEIESQDGDNVTDSASRWGYCLASFDDYDSAQRFVTQ